MQKADGNRRTAFIQELARSGAKLGLVQRGENLTGVQGALLHPQGQTAGHQRLVGFDEHVEHRAVQVPDPAAHLDDVAKPLGGDHAHLGPALGDQDIGPERGAMDDLFHLAQELLQALPVVLGGLAHRGKKTARGVLRGRGGLEALQLARFLEHQTVGEGPAYVDGQLLHCAFSACVCPRPVVRPWA